MFISEVNQGGMKMNELKTLKDIKPEQRDFKLVIKDEAIKWVKEDIKDMNKGIVFMAIDSTKRWMKRLDITEEDLKTKSRGYKNEDK